MNTLQVQKTSGVKVQAFVYSKIGIHKLELCVRVVYITVSASSTDCVLHYVPTPRLSFCFTPQMLCGVLQSRRAYGFG